MAIDEVKSALTTRWKVPADKADLLARLSHGSLGWAVAAIDSNLLEQHDTQMEEILAVIDTGLEDRFDYAAQLASEFGQDREKVQDKLALWLDWWHDLILVKCSLIDIVTNIDRLDELKRMADSLKLTQIKETMESITYWLASN